ncbi:MAG TPA: hypothetical protein VMS08_06180, partial [Candidatus Saccharimonadia bacterium]|nr:hypothetical protein [Candidatus Saccharimonadia bacterium]
MSQYLFSPHSPRVTEAKLAHILSPAVTRGLQVISALVLLGSALLLVTGHHEGLSLTGVFCILAVIIVWIRRELEDLPGATVGATHDLSILLPKRLLAVYSPSMTTGEFWSALSTLPNANFLMVRFGLHPDDVSQSLEGWSIDHDKLFDETTALCQKLGIPAMTEAAIMGALFHLCPGLQKMLAERRLSQEDLDEGVHWVARIALYDAAGRPVYG